MRGGTWIVKPLGLCLSRFGLTTGETASIEKLVKRLRALGLSSFVAVVMDQSRSSGAARDLLPFGELMAGADSTPFGKLTAGAAFSEADRAFVAARAVWGAAIVGGALAAAASRAAARVMGRLAGTPKSAIKASFPAALCLLRLV